MGNLEPVRTKTTARTPVHIPMHPTTNSRLEGLNVYVYAHCCVFYDDGFTSKTVI